MDLFSKLNALEAYMRVFIPRLFGPFVSFTSGLDRLIVVSVFYRMGAVCISRSFNLPSFVVSPCWPNNSISIAFMSYKNKYSVDKSLLPLLKFYSPLFPHFLVPSLIGLTQGRFLAFVDFITALACTCKVGF